MLCPVVSVGALTMNDKQTFITLGAIVAIGVVVFHLTLWALQGIGVTLQCINL